MSRLLLIMLILAAGTPAAAQRIVLRNGASPLEILAARELQRYVYLRTGRLPPIAPKPGRPPEIVVSLGSRAVRFGAPRVSLSSQQYRLLTHRGRLYVLGGDGSGVLYGAYRLAERLGVRFGLHGDVLPDTRMAFRLPNVNETGSPLFALRGIQPFHDFSEGPDWWNLDDYLAVIGQLPKLGMNFIGLHSYPSPEPTVWIGTKADLRPDGALLRGHVSSWMNTLRIGWGSVAKRTSLFTHGASQLFPVDAYGSDVMLGHCPEPISPQGKLEVLNRAADLLKGAFTFARLLGVRTCVGTETPMTPPREVLARLPRSATWAEPLGGNMVTYPQPIAGTEEDSVYQSVRWDVKGYRLRLPNGTYRLKLMFCEVAYATPGSRVFGVRVQGQEVIPRLDMVAEAGPNVAIDREVPDVHVTDGVLRIDFVPIVEFPAIAGIEVIGNGITRKLDCAGRTPGYTPETIGLEHTRALYEGIFTRIQSAYPIDYYWLWTPEGWTWSGASDLQVEETLQDIRIALDAARAVKAPFTIATCGWVLGPPKDRAMFHDRLPKDVPFSAINRNVGNEPVDPAFARLQGRPRWAIPWLEDDPTLTTPQLWVGRMYRDASDALRYGCTGLMGIHWRTRVLSMNVRALAEAGWHIRLPGDAKSFYRDWCWAEFGPEVAEDAAAIFAQMDGRLPKTSVWTDGPGGIQPDGRPLEQILQPYSFVQKFAALAPRVRGAGCSARYQYWLHQFQGMVATEKLKNLWFDFEEAMQRVREAPDTERRRELAQSEALAARRALVRQLGEVYSHLLATVSTTGELGTVDNWERHILPTLIDQPERELEALLGARLPSDCRPPREYRGPLRLVLPTARGSANVGERLTLRVLVLSERKPSEIALNVRPMGRGAYRTIPLKHKARGVYTVTLPPVTLAGLEYYVVAKDCANQVALAPAAGPAMPNTVIALPRWPQNRAGRPQTVGRPAR